MDVHPIDWLDSRSVVEKVEQANNVSSELSSSHQQEFYKQKKYKKQESNNKHRYSEKNLIEIIENTNRHFDEKNVKMKLEIHKLTNRLVIRLIDTKNDEIIKVISSEEVFDEIVSNWGIVGNLIDMEG
ncbi:flagellar protein FlaG [Vagococcus fluvialis]|uniref:flagellar protein FlaG n=1 Tax=Vagococcus fluvialis TaxID=2738 RepID=UPI003D1330A2